MFSKRMTAFRVLIVTYLDAIDEFMQPGTVTNAPTMGVNCNTMKGQL